MKMSSSTNKTPASSSTSAQPAEKTFFEQQREILLKEIGIVSSTSLSHERHITLTTSLEL
jgi:hypothetical protein